MRRPAVTWVLLLGVMSFSCKDDAVTPPVEPPGKQHDFPWPSLADSPWPMYQADPQHTGRSRYVGPQQGVIAWTFEFIGYQKGSYVSIGGDRTIYFVSSASNLDSVPSAYLYAVSAEGSFKWRRNIWSLPWPPGEAPAVHNAPLIGADGTVYVGSSDGYFYAVAPDGRVRWKYSTNSEEVSNGSTGALIGLDNTIYFTDGAGLRALDKEGNEEWFLPGHGGGVPIFSPDGQTLYVLAQQGLTALNLDGSVKWKFEESPFSYPLVDSDGNVYVASDSVVHSLNPNGTIRWVTSTREQDLRINPTIGPTIDKDGNLYYEATPDGGYTNYIVSLDYEGKFRWKTIRIGGGFTADLTCDADGTVYYTSSVGQAVGAISQEGLPRWEISGIGQFIFSDVALSADGLLFVTTYSGLDTQRSRLLAIR